MFTEISSRMFPSSLKTVSLKRSSTRCLYLLQQDMTELASITSRTHLLRAGNYFAVGSATV